MNVLGDYLARPFCLIFRYQFCDQQLIYDRSGNLLAPADIFRISFLVNHPRHYPTFTACPRVIPRPSTVLYPAFPRPFPQP